MPYFQIPSRRTRQPQTIARVDWAHQLAPCFYANMHPAWGAIVQSSGIYGPLLSPTWAAFSGYGVSNNGLFWSGNGTDYLNLGGAPISNKDQPFTIAYYSRSATAPTYAGVATWMPSGATQRFCVVRTTDTSYKVGAGKAVGSIPVAIAAPIATNNTLERVLITCPLGADGTGTATGNVVYINAAGNSYALNSTAAFTSQTANTNTLGWDGADSKWAGLFGEFAVWPRVLTAAEIAAYYANPYQFLQFDPRRIFFTGGGAGAVTGTLSGTDGADAAAFAGTHTAPSVTGTLAATDGADAAAFAGAESFTGALAATDGADAASFSGSSILGATGTLAATDGADVAAFAGAESFTGTLAATDGADLAAFTGSHTEAGVTSGTLAATDGADAASFDGAQTITGSLAAADGADLAAFAGIHLQNITGTFTGTDGADAAAFVGTMASEVTGTLDATDGADEALFESEGLGGRPILARRRKRYLIKDRVYDDLDPADVIAAAKEAGVDLGDVREVVKEPAQRKAAPRRADDDGREYWLPQEFWGRAAARQKLEATSPLGEEFQRAVEALRASAGPLQARRALRMRQEEEAILLLMT